MNMDLVLYEDWRALDMGIRWAVYVIVLGKRIWARMLRERKAMGH